MEVSSDPGKSGGDSHVSSLLGVSVQQYFRDHFIGYAYLGFFLAQQVLAGSDQDASWVQSELREDAGVTSDKGIIRPEF